MEPTNDNPTTEPRIYHGLGGLLDRIPRNTPRDAWAALAIVPDGSADRTAISEVGVMIRRDALCEGIDSVRAKLPAAEIDALLVAAGYAVSMAASHIMRAAVAAARASHRGELPAEIRAVVDDGAGKIGAADQHMESMIRLASAVAGLAEPKDEGEREAARTRNELLGGCVLMHSLATIDGDSPALPHVGRWLLEGSIASLRAEDARREKNQDAEGEATDEG
jgi:hypothetical protein